MRVDLWAVTPGAACVTAGASFGNDKAQGKLRAAIVKMSLKSLILGRMAGENEIYLLLYGNCTVPSVIFLQTSLNNCPHPQSVLKVGASWPSAPAECSVFVLLCTRRNEGCISWGWAALNCSILQMSAVCLWTAGVFCVNTLLVSFSWCFYKPGACLE